MLLSLSVFAQRSEILLEKNWKFHKGDVGNALSGYVPSSSDARIQRHADCDSAGR